MSRRDLAETLLRKADQDKSVFEKLRPDPDIAVDILGFHAQQAAEKIAPADRTCPASCDNHPGGRIHRTVNGPIRSGERSSPKAPTVSITFAWS